MDVNSSLYELLSGSSPPRAEISWLLVFASAPSAASAKIAEPENGEDT